MKKNIAFVLIVSLILLFFIVIKDNTKKETVQQVKKEKVEPAPVKQVQEKVKLKIVDVKDIQPIKEEIIPIKEEFGFTDLLEDSSTNEVKVEKIVLKKSNDYLPPRPKKQKKEVSEETYFYNGRVISKEEYLRLNINENVKPEELYDDTDYSTNNLDDTLNELAPEPVKKVRAKKSNNSDTPDLNDLFN